MNPDGSVDTTFYFPPGGGGDVIHTILPQADGTVFIGGELDSVPNHSVQRLNADGSPNNVPLVSPNLANGADAIGVQSDGKIIVSLTGAPTPYEGQDTGAVVRLNPDGSLDNTFLSGSIPVEAAGVSGLFIQPDDKIVLAANLPPTHLPTLQQGIDRLNSDGTVDTSFDADGGVNEFGNVLAIALDPSGRIVLGGSFSSVGGASFPWGGAAAQRHNGPGGNHHGDHHRRGSPRRTRTAAPARRRSS